MGKRYKECIKLVDKTKKYQISEALEIIEKMPKTTKAYVRNVRLATANDIEKIDSIVVKKPVYDIALLDKIKTMDADSVSKFMNGQTAKNKVVSDKTVSSWENDRTQPKIEVIEQICRVLRIPKAEIIGKDYDVENTYEMTKEELDMLKLFRQLDEIGRIRAISYLEGLTENRRNF